MQDPEAYIRGNILQVQGAQKCLSEYIHLIKWKESGEDIMDVGCGPGYTTWNILKKFLPENCGTIHAVDKQERMLEYGKNIYPKVNFIHLDFGSCEFPAQFNNSIDHIFSFFCFQWIADQRQLMKNLFNTLKPGGDVLAMFSVTSLIFDLYKNMIKINKWSKYDKVFLSGIIQYKSYKFVEKSFENILLNTGFEILMIKCEDNPYVFQSVEEFKDFMIGISPLPNNPPNLREDFITDAVKELQNMGIIKENVSHVTFPQKYVSFCIRKPMSM